MTEVTRLNCKRWEDVPEEYNLWGGGEPTELNAGDLKHMMTGKLVTFSDDGEYGHHLRLSQDAIEWLKELTYENN